MTDSEWVLYELMVAPLVACGPECDAMCVCDGGEQCEHTFWAFDDEDDRYCVDCFVVLYDDEED